MAAANARVAAVICSSSAGFQCLQVDLREPLPLIHQPLVVAALQQLAGIGLDRLLQPPLRQRPLEMLDIQPQRRIRAPPERPRSEATA
jgi:hypothetical protein